jgi:hypothetical protein
MLGILNLALVLLACTMPILAIIGVVHFFKYKERTAQYLHHMQNEIDLASKTELKREVQELRERVQVLEAIVTDSKYDLMQEFEHLAKGKK